MNTSERIYPNLTAWNQDHTLTELVPVTGKDLSTLSRYKSGEREPDLATALVMSRHCRIPLESLIKPRPAVEG